MSVLPWALSFGSSMKTAADQIRAFANRMAGLAAARFKQFLAVRGVSRSLFRQRRPGDCGLPEVSRDRLNLVVLQAELRHFGGGTEFVRMLQPVRNPFLVNFHPDFLQIR